MLNYTMCGMHFFWWAILPFSDVDLIIKKNAQVTGNTNVHAG